MQLDQTYHYFHLSVAQRQIYQRILTIPPGHSVDASVPALCTKDECTAAILAAHYDRPEIVWLYWWKQYRTVNLFGRVKSFHLDASIGEAETFHCLSLLREKRDALRQTISEKWDEDRKYRKIADTIATPFSYRFTNNYTYDHSLLGPLLHNTGVCEGVSLYFHYLCLSCNLPSVVISGKYGNTSDEHAWNMIRIQGQNYYLDLTSLSNHVHTYHRYPSPMFYTQEQMIEAGYSWKISK
ncbi:MAG: hypothetical protein IJ719_09290 [Clostridia bacterium]|nr:hypothetical protein [Clostridia bacterium]